MWARRHNRPAQLRLPRSGACCLHAAALRAPCQVATLYGQPVFRATATKLITPKADFDSGDQRCAWAAAVAAASAVAAAVAYPVPAPLAQGERPARTGPPH
jgi:hypothetical protein